MKVTVNALRKCFGKTVALNDINLAVADGEFLALLGPSGSGKTSLLRMLAGLEFADSGNITFGERAMDGVPARERGIGFVFQHYALFRHMTVARNVSFGLDVLARRRRPSPSEIRARVQSLLDLMGIADLAERYPHQISGGQRQRVALARALATGPGLLLLDEPFGALDAKVRKNLRVWLRDVHDRMGLTSIFVTHDQAEAMEMADRVAILRAGRIEQVDTPDRLHAEPANAFVHEFLGDSVRFACTVRDGCAYFDGLPLPALPAACPPGPALALIRPHEIGLLPGPGPAQVTSLHVAGLSRRAGIALGRQTLEVVQTAQCWTPMVGEACGLDLSKARFYAADSEVGATAGVVTEVA